jgi:hypothetical protein
MAKPSRLLRLSRAIVVDKTPAVVLYCGQGWKEMRGWRREHRRGVGVVVVHTLCSLRFFAVFGLAARGGESLSLSLSLSISLPHAVKTPAVISVNPSSGALVNHSTSEE